jgi:hypothetical protein
MAFGHVSSQGASFFENLSTELAGVVGFLLPLLEDPFHIRGESAHQPVQLLIDTLKGVGEGVGRRIGDLEDPERVWMGSAVSLLQHESIIMFASWKSARY